MQFLTKLRPRMNQVNQSLKVAIVGSGPAGCYAAAALLKSFTEINIDIYDRLFSPYGLVRSGVAPDHSKIKNVQAQFEKTLSDPRCRFMGNVDIGKDIAFSELHKLYSAVILTHGADSDRKLNLTGEDLSGSYTATEFVAWYNCHPEFADRHFNFSTKRAAIIGQGNVAIDVARILVKPVEQLALTDIGTHAVKALSNSTIEDIYVIGRRGPVQAAFTDKELKELGEISDCEVVIDKSVLELSDIDKQELEQTDKVKRSNFRVLNELAEMPSRSAKRRLHLIFFRSPVEISGNGKVENLKLEKNTLTGSVGNQKASGSGVFEDLPVDLIFRSVGYLGNQIPGLPFDSNRGVYPNERGRVLGADGEHLQGVYTAGWIKRGPSGVIGTNKACSVETVNSIVEDGLTPSNGDVDELIKQKGLRVITFADWRKLDAEEIRRGVEKGKEREKFVSVEDVFAFLS